MAGKALGFTVRRRQRGGGKEKELWRGWFRTKIEEMAY